MIVAAAVCPHPPLLFRELTGERDVAAELRAAAGAAVATTLAAGPDLVVVVGGSDRTASWDPGLSVDVRSFGTTGARPVTTRLPLSLGVASRLLTDAGWKGPVLMHTIAWDATPQQVDGLAEELTGVDGRVVLLVLGEGSTRRGDKAPGYIDERAFPFDEETGRALASGDAATLESTDPALAEELMVSGRAPFGVLAAAVRREGASPKPQLLYQDDPWGVMYFVATWLFSA